MSKYRRGARMLALVKMAPTVLDTFWPHGGKSTTIKPKESAASTTVYCNQLGREYLCLGEVVHTLAERSPTAADFNTAKPHTA